MLSMLYLLVKESPYAATSWSPGSWPSAPFVSFPTLLCPAIHIICATDPGIRCVKRSKRFFPGRKIRSDYSVWTPRRSARNIAWQGQLTCWLSGADQKRSVLPDRRDWDPKRTFTAGKRFYFAELFGGAAFYVRGK